VFIGHIAVGLAAKRVAPRASLAVLMAAPLWLDLLWPFLVLAGVEVVRIEPGATAFTPLDFAWYPWSHSLALTLFWAALFGGIYRVVTGYAAGAAAVAVGVASHWVLDLATHRPDLPLWPGGVRVGLGLWRSVPGTIVIEGALFAAGVALYAGATRPRNRAGVVALWALVAFVSVIYVANLLGPPPPSARAVGTLALAQWLFVPWAALIDRNRELRPSLRASPA